MAIQVGDKIPSVKLKAVDSAGVKDVTDTLKSATNPTKMGLDRLSDQMRDLDHQRSSWQGQLSEQVLDMRMATDTHALTRIFGLRRQMHSRAVIRRACQFHRQIYRALDQRDAASARRWMGRHLRQSKKEALSRFDRTVTAGENIPLRLPAALQEQLDRIAQDLGTKRLS